MKNRYMPTASSIYVFFVVYGMAAIMIAQHVDELQAQWGSTEGAVLQAIAGVGIGKLIGPTFAGLLSDRIGRRWMLVASFVLYAAFLGGILISPNAQVGFALAVLFGIANAISDTGAYPTLMEAFPARAGTANLLVKAAIALGQFLIPLIVTAVAAASIYWGWVPIGLIVILGLLLLLNLRLPFPDYKAIAAAQQAQIDAGAGSQDERAGSKIAVEGVALVLFGFTSTSILFLVSNFMPLIGRSVAGMDEAASKTLVSFYSLGSLVGVLVTAALVARWLRPTFFLILNPAIAALGFVGFLLLPNPGVYRVLATVIGFTAAAGLFQLAVVVLAEFFPVRKGFVTSLVGFASGVAAFTMPFVSGAIVGGSEGEALVDAYRTVVWLGIGVSAASALLAVIILLRHRKVFPQGAPKVEPDAAHQVSV